MIKLARYLVVLGLTSLVSINAMAQSASDKKNQTLAKGDQFPTYTYEDPHEVKHEIKPSTKYVLVSFEMEISKGIHTWLAEKDPDYLAKHNAEYVADISKMPTIITFLFARPKMKRYNFPILLTKDESFAPKFPILEGKFAVFELDQDRKVTEVRYFKDMDSLARVVFNEGNALPSVPDAKE